jgi:hypothetical protein
MFSFATRKNAHDGRVDGANRRPSKILNRLRRRVSWQRTFGTALPLSPKLSSYMDAQKEELDRRLQAYARNPDEGISWGELKDALRKSS